MAILLRGKRKGETVEIHQFCNDWVMLEDGKIVSPASLEYDLDEIKRLLKEDTGMMFQRYHFIGNRLAKRKIA